VYRHRVPFPEYRMEVEVMAAEGAEEEGVVGTAAVPVRRRT
jgi:hypothetical protein